MTRTALHLNLLVFLVTASFLNPHPTQAIGNPVENLPSFADFSSSVRNGEADIIRGVYVQNVLALPIVQQPGDEPYYVSNSRDEITQFAMASQHGNIGLLAHNTLSGKFFSQISLGQPIYLIYGNGRVEYFVVTKILRFQASKPESVSSTFRNLDRNEILSSNEMFNRVYNGEHHLVFQTCIEEDGNASWGRLFVLAVPAN